MCNVPGCPCVNLQVRDKLYRSGYYCYCGHNEYRHAPPPQVVEEVRHTTAAPVPVSIGWLMVYGVASADAIPEAAHIHMQPLKRGALVQEALREAWSASDEVREAYQGIDLSEATMMRPLPGGRVAAAGVRLGDVDVRLDEGFEDVYVYVCRYV
jgi:hypothetical protein